MQHLTIELDYPLQNVVFCLGETPAAALENRPSIASVEPPVPQPDLNPVAPQPQDEQPNPISEITNDLLGQIHRACVQLVENQSNSLGELRASAVELAIEIADTLIHHHVEQSSARLESLIREALDQFHVASEISIRLNPADFQRLSNVGFPTSDVTELDWVSDESISVGDCHLTSAQLTLVADRKRLMQTIRETLLKEVSQ